jgi:hypothetical protein
MRSPRSAAFATLLAALASLPLPAETAGKTLRPVGGRGWRVGDKFGQGFSKPPATLEKTCGRCHATPAPDVIVRAEWPRILKSMEAKLRASPEGIDEAAFREAADWYSLNAPVDFDRLPRAPDDGALEFRRTSIGGAKRTAPMVTNVAAADLDGDGALEVLACDGALNTVSTVRREGGAWKETTLAEGDVPVRSAAFDADGDGDADVAVACLGGMLEDDALAGSVLLLVNRGADGWEKRILAKDLPRVTDARPADVDGDGDRDLVIGAFGAFRTGLVGWLRNDGASWELVKVADRNGVIHVPVADFDADGRTDFAALAAQQHESITLYLNRRGTFEARTVWEARNPLFGSSGLVLDDLDRDGDPDMLFTNGDAMSDPCLLPWPYHGVQWLENRGKLEFAFHDIGRCYGPFAAVPADLDGDGDTDVAVAVLFGWWENKGESGLLWYENDGKMGFACHNVPGPTRFATIAAGDLDGDGAPDLVTGRITLNAPDVEDSALLLWSVSKRE